MGPPGTRAGSSRMAGHRRGTDRQQDRPTRRALSRDTALNHTGQSQLISTIRTRNQHMRRNPDMTINSSSNLSSTARTDENRSPPTPGTRTNTSGSAGAAQADSSAHPQHDIDSPENRARRERGLEVLASIDGDAGRAVMDSLADISPALAHHIAAFGFGDVYARLDLDARSRQLVTIGVLTALGGCEPQLRIHLNAALNVGLSREEIVEAILHASVYAGFPRALNATLTAKEVFAEHDAVEVS